MTVSASVDVIRGTSSLSAIFPGTIARMPESSAASADSRRSSRSPASRECSSRPWQLKQWVARIGWMSRV